MENPW